LGEGLLDTTRPILGYVVAIAVVLLIATLGFMAATSTNLTSAANVMASILVLIALLVGISVAAKAADKV
jgi:uncharacterized membrane protein